MKAQRKDEFSCKRECDDDLAQCEEGSIYTEACDDRWDYCMDHCLSACETS